MGAKAVIERVRKIVVPEYQNEFQRTKCESEISGARVRTDCKEHCMTP